MLISSLVPLTANIFIMLGKTYVLLKNNKTSPKAYRNDIARNSIGKK